MNSSLSFRAGLLILGVAIGCADSSKEPGKTAGGSADTSTPIPAPVPFEEVPLATDSSYQASPITPGSNVGAVSEFTALKIPFCWCPPGVFQMGSPPDAPGHQLNETQFEVTISRGFWIQQTEVTQAQYQALMGVNPSHFEGERNPVETVSWDEATEFCRRLSALPTENSAGNSYRLPTEAEWEYACRAGATTVYGFGDDESEVDAYGWVNRNSERTTHPVASKRPNAWGLYDMHGNVSEWCRDWYGEYSTGPVTDPLGPDSGEKRCLRGGGLLFIPDYSRCSHRDAYIPTARYIGLGFRVVAEVSAPVE